MGVASPHAGGSVLAVKVAAGSSRERVVGRLGDRVKVAVRKPPEKGAANEAVLGVLAQALGVRAADLEILHGQTRPEKEILVRGLDPGEVSRRLGMS